MITFEQIGQDELCARFIATMQYKIGTVDVNGEERVAVDFMDGRGWVLVDPTPYILAAIEQAAKQQSSTGTSEQEKK